MKDCEVCLEPECADFTITVTAPDAELYDLAICSDCAALAFGAMLVRTKGAIVAQNKSMAFLRRLLGLEIPS